MDLPTTTEANTSLQPLYLSLGDSGSGTADSTNEENSTIHHPIEAYDVGSFATDGTVSQAREVQDQTSLNYHGNTSCNTEYLEILKLMELPTISYPPPQRLFFELFSGPHAPLTSQILHFGISCLQPMDILCDPQMDILDNTCYEQLLRLASSRVIGSLSAAPPCKEYTLLKLIPGGPPPCRTPQNMDTPVVDEPACVDRFFSSQEILFRTVQLLTVNFYHGGVSSLEQPSSAMSWDEPFVQGARDHFLLHTAEFSHCNFLEDDEEPFQKEWRFVSSIAGFSKASATCTCGRTHASFRGKRLSSGDFVSSTTAEYPKLLGKHLCRFILLEDMVVPNPVTISWKDALRTLLHHPPMRFSHIPDGASLVSSALWPIPYVPDAFRMLRNSLHDLIFRHRLDLRLQTHIHQKVDASPFDPEVKSQNIEIFQNFLAASGFAVDLSIPEDQPFRLSAFQHLAEFAEDPDSAFVDELKKGVSLGVDSLIPPSGTWPLKQTGQPTESSSLETCLSNWSSAENQDDILTRLLEEEIDQGFVQELRSDEEAKTLFGDKFAVGKLAIVSNHSGKHRLVLDSTVCSLNQLSANNIQEHITYPRIQDVRQCIGASVSQQSTLFNIDVKAAHKRIKVHHSNRGLLSFRALGRLFCYRTLHFGGSCSAYYWARTSSLLMRLSHRILYLYHSGFVFVDDFLFNFSSPVAALQACTILLLFDFLNVPISWNKLQLAHQVTWIGWNLNTTTCLVSIPDDKLLKLRMMLSRLRTPGKFLRQEVEKLAGNLLWLSDIVTSIRWVLGRLYAILSRPGIQLVRLQKQQIQFITSNSCEKGVLQLMLQQPYVPQGSIVQRIGKIQRDKCTSWIEFAKSASMLPYAWTSFINCRSNRVPVYETEADIFANIFDMFSVCIPSAPLCQPLRTKIFAGADAFAEQTNFGLGGWIQFPAKCLWFSLQGRDSQLPVNFHTGNLQSHILTFETLAQVILLLMIYESKIRGIDLELITCLDNQAAEGILAAGFTQLPVASKIIQVYHQLSQLSGAVLTPMRTSSKDNSRADDLSRGATWHEAPSDCFSLDLFPLIQRWFSDHPTHRRA